MTKYKVKTIIAAILILLVIIIIVQNRGAVETHIFFSSPDISLAVLVFITFAMGVITGLLLANRMAKPRNQHKP